MTRTSATTTSVSLLTRLRQNDVDQVAWAEFVARYGPLVYHWCRGWNLQASDAEDVTQAVLVKLTQKLRAFIYDPSRSFRAYLKTVAHYAWCDFLESRKQPASVTGGSEALEALENVAARDDLLQRLTAAFDQEVLEEATARVQARVEPHTWEAFRLTALDGMSGVAAGARLGIKVATVFKARSKVQKMLQEEIARLEGV